MAGYRGTTEQRGLGYAHRADRERLLAALRDGEPCWRCGQPMYKSQPLDRDHVVDRALGGTQGPAVLAHRWCNRSAGAKLGNQLRPRDQSRGITAPGYNPVCRTCGRPYGGGRAPRICEVCGEHYHPNHGEQRSCGRRCGVELRRRIYGPSGRSREGQRKRWGGPEAAVRRMRAAGTEPITPTGWAQARPW